MMASSASAIKQSTSPPLDGEHKRERRPNPLPWRKRLLVTPDEAANILSISRSKLYELIDAQKIPAFKIDGETSVRIRTQWLIERVDGQQEGKAVSEN